MLNAILMGWESEGVRTLEQAQKSNEKNRARFAGKQKKSPVQVQGERTFDPAELDNFTEEL